MKNHPDQCEFDFTPPEQRIDYQKFFHGTDEDARNEADKVAPRVAPKPKPKKLRRRPLTILAEGKNTLEEAVEKALPLLVDGEGDFLELYNFQFGGVKDWRVMRVNDLLGYRTALRKMPFVGGDWIIPVGREIMHVYREGRRAIQNHRVAMITVTGKKLKRQRVIHRILEGE